MTDADIIVALGDTGEVSRLLDVTQTTVSNWKGRGIPWQMRPQVKDLARRRKVKVPLDFLTTKGL